MTLLFIIMFNGFLFSITSSSVHTKKADPSSPVLQSPSGIKEQAKPNGSVKQGDLQIKKEPVQPEDDCPLSLAS